MKKPYSSVVVSYGPDPSRCESLNIGVVLLTNDGKVAVAEFLTSWTRISHAFPSADIVLLRRVGAAIRAHCEQTTSDAESKLRLGHTLTVQALCAEVLGVTESSFRVSAPIVGISLDPVATTRELFHALVQPATEMESDDRVDDESVWRSFTKLFPTTGYAKRLTAEVVRGRYTTETFKRCWQNGVTNIVEPVSFDLANSSQVQHKANALVGKFDDLAPAMGTRQIHLVVAVPGAGRDAEVWAAGQAAQQRLREKFGDKFNLYSSELEQRNLSEKIVRDMDAHPPATPDEISN